MSGELALLQNDLLVGAVLFALGLAGFLLRRNLIIMFLCVEMMLQGVSLTLVGWGRFHGNWSAQTLVVFVITVAACEAGIALSMVLILCRRSGSLDVAFWQRVREDGVRAYVDHEVPEELDSPPQWPSLAPAGLEAPADPREAGHRTHV